MSKTTHHLLSHVLVVLATAFATAAAPPAVAVDTEDLPDIGAPWDSLLSRSEEDQIGRMIVYQLREADQLLDDPELSEYIQTIGHRLSVTPRAVRSASSSSWCATRRSTPSRFRAATSA